MEYPIGAPQPKDNDVVSVLMQYQLAKLFEERCLNSNAELAGPLLFEEDDLPTYIIGLKQP